jgi:four helix bundle protein
MSPPYEKLVAWKLCHELALAVRKETRNWSEDRALSSQLRRAAFSAAANIVEGCTRRGPAEFRRYLDISLGSLSEVEYGLRFAVDAEILPTANWEVINIARRRAQGTTRQLYKVICKRIDAKKKKKGLLDS